MTSSLILVRIIGSFDKEIAKNNYSYRHEELLQLFPLSMKNKIPLLYLESVKRVCGNFDETKKPCVLLKQKQKAVLSLIKKIVNTLSKYNINYSVFKTLKPFPFIASDIDLLFFSDEGSRKALKAFTQGGYKLSGSKFGNFTVIDVESGIKIDLYDKITVSNMVYVDKRKIEEYVVETTIDEVQAPVLAPEADLIVTIAHSFYKEQLYTLADFYAISRLLTQFTSRQKDTFIKLVKAQHIEFACSLLLELTQTIHLTAFGTKLGEIAETSSKLQLNSLLNTTMQRTLERFAKKMKMPYKYNYTTLAMALADKILKDKNTKYSLPYQIKDLLLKPQFLREFMKQLVIHITRETY